MAFIWPTNMAARVGEQQLAPLGRCGAVQFSPGGAFTDRSHGSCASGSDPIKSLFKTKHSLCLKAFLKRLGFFSIRVE